MYKTPEISLELILVSIYKDLYTLKDSNINEFSEKMLECMSDLDVLYRIQGQTFHFTPKTPMDDFLSNFRNLVYSRIPLSKIHSMFNRHNDNYSRRAFNTIFPERDEFKSMFINNCEIFFIWYNRFDVSAYEIAKIRPTNLKYVDIGKDFYKDVYIARYSNPHKDTFKMKKKIFYEREDYFIDKPVSKYRVL